MHHRSPSRNSNAAPRRDSLRSPASSSRQEQADPRYSPSDSHQMQPSLPSIHHLHPYLAPAVPQHAVPGPSYVSSEQPSMATVMDPAALEQRRESRDLGPPDSDVEEQGPPKKKRRRQALSCTDADRSTLDATLAPLWTYKFGNTALVFSWSRTIPSPAECKRRKIKAQPCGPCSRRGEANKCQWNIVEPTDKYVTRAEYDELKYRFDNLEASIARLLPGFAATSGPVAAPPYISAPNPSGAAIPQAGSMASTAPASSGMPSAVYPAQYAPDIPPASDYHVHAQYDPRNAPAPSSQPSRRLHLPLPSLQPPSASITSPTAPKPSPLSLAAITTPYDPGAAPDSRQSKNYQAQALTALLGERLRLSPQPPEDPVHHRLQHQYRQLLQVRNG
ncbi:hypothetical protein GLOTRDRAFT_138409 [Gloeophyllum trabeum ATCC 11539]|uniref:Zn(2)-C6 fungal-type domain-containing protein n=1 Tax=Gloeophyllum trabeum (strain ATCC 11539 / FP-39264 / Madison 617) TaxID=670483 RepID=S7QBN8_GLOTA|nr:uncharacterized protein GLOTRDRAFT_138409 [Gloeophyllum trabeum ATCC 11539]EPQ56767.1 hypothetical protein GLOTRDRAFT_138409 [Gloeophyllum trabeum ATCC 11539]